MGKNPHDDGAIHDHRHQGSLATTDGTAQDFQAKDAAHELSHQVAVVGALGLGGWLGGVQRQRGSGAFYGNDFITP